jgi:excisionase family DNA binding protein
MAKKAKSRNPRRPIVVVDIPTAASLLDVSTATLYRWISQGHVGFIRLPSGVRRIPLREISKITELPVEHLIDVLRYM